MELNNTDFLEAGHSSHKDRGGCQVTRTSLSHESLYPEGPPKRCWAVAGYNLGRAVCNIPYILLLYDVLLEGY